MTDVLDLLADGAVHSGQELAGHLGVSRTAVWKQIGRWQERGLVIEVLPGRGYRWQAPLEWWNEAVLRQSLSEASNALLQVLHIARELPSTNDTVADLRRTGLPSPQAVLAESQTAGRGRRGRQWESPLGACFCGSIGWTFTGGFSVLEGLSLAVGVAVVNALRRYGMSGVGLKWPNDIMVGDAKLGGVLIELQAEANGLCHVVIGIGLNLSLPPGLAERVGREVTDVQSCTGAPLARNRLGGMLLDEILQLLADYEAKGFAGWQAQWGELDVMRGQQVEVSGLEQPVIGIAAGVDARGALLVESAGGLVAVAAGEVSLRRA